MVVVTIGNQQRHECVVRIVNGENVMTQTYLGLNIGTVLDSCRFVCRVFLLCDIKRTVSTMERKTCVRLRKRFLTQLNPDRDRLSEIEKL